MRRFTIRGEIYEIDAEKVRQAVKGNKPGPINKYYVEIDSQRYPIKQVLATVCDIPPISFTSVDAYRILDRLGFKIQLT